MKIGIIGLGLIGGSILKSLANKDFELYAVTRNETTIENAKKSLEARFIELASKDEDIFIELGSYVNLSRVSTIEMCEKRGVHLL